MKCLAPILLLALAGCAMPKPAAKQLPADAPAVRVQLVRVSPTFDDARLQERLSFAARAYADVGINFNPVAVFSFDNSDWYEVVEGDFPNISAWVRANSAPGVKTILLVDSIIYQSRVVGGLAFRGNGYALVAANSCKDSIAHEAGHLLGLPHAEDGCPIMKGSACCMTGSTFSADEAATMKVNLGKPGAARAVLDERPVICVGR